MQIAVNLPNEQIAEKVLWFLDHLKNEGVRVLQYNTTQFDELSNKEILENFKEGLKELKAIKNNSNNNLQTMEEFLNEL